MLETFAYSSEGAAPGKANFRNSPNKKQMNETPNDPIATAKVIDHSAQSTAAAGAVVLLKNYWLEAQEIFLHPSAFFDSINPEPAQPQASDSGTSLEVVTSQRTAGYVEPLIFLAISAGVYAFMQAVSLLNPLLLITLFFSSIVKTGIGAFIGYQVMKAMGGKGSLEATFRVLAYSKVTLLIAWISIGILPIGGFVSIFYGVYLNIIGCSKAHALSKMKTATALMLMAALGYIVALTLHI